MHFDGFDDEQWDEFKWEAHLNEVEKKSEQLRKFIASDRKGNTPRWITLLQESQNEDDAFEAYVEEELLMDEAYFPEDEDDWEDDDDDWDEDDFLFGFEDEEPFMDFGDEDDFDDFDEGDEWKSLSDEYTYSDYADLESLDTYLDAKDFAVDILKWAEKIHPKFQSREFQDFVDEVLKVGAKIAGGHSFGFEQDYIGANIAYSKKALGCANHSLELLQAMKKQGLFNKKQYQELHARLFELRNDIGIYIQELRDQFRLGLE
ncbi:hypothetical protein SAMN06265219_105195 [Gracilimonas mengyeensis]|uniref:Uncharacterized protein n=2 Tax=Gracilimonas mengyeensis TaxID=1302730 RepID=A0A521CIE0_9BACT|nr:hypothetical protein SAMN06265219_105195 [Gracilimonas mengyeensis]